MIESCSYIFSVPYLWMAMTNICGDFVQLLIRATGSINQLILLLYSLVNINFLACGYLGPQPGQHAQVGLTCVNDKLALGSIKCCPCVLLKMPRWARICNHAKNPCGLFLCPIKKPGERKVAREKDVTAPRQEVVHHITSSKTTTTWHFVCYY